MLRKLLAMLRGAINRVDLYRSKRWVITARFNGLMYLVAGIHYEPAGACDNLDLHIPFIGEFSFSRLHTETLNIIENEKRRAAVELLKKSADED